jgi:hypothetical protein
MKKYPDIKPGTVITSNSYKNFTSFEKLLPGSIYTRLGEGSYAQLGNITIVPTLHYYQYREYIDATKKNEGKAKIGSRDELIGWVAGYPFPHTKNNPKEIYYNYDRLSVVGDNIYFSPNTYTMFNRKNKVERVEKGDLQWMNFRGRVKLPPKPVIPGYEDYYEKGSILMQYPYDLKGFAAVRGRFVNPNKPDEFISYVPALRRIRRLAGTDTQDPIIGTDISWEDWRGWWQKIELWPTEFKVKDTEILVPMRSTHTRVKVDESGKITGYWEIRPAYLLEATLKVKTYLYSKRRVWLDKELFSLIHIEMDDVRGNLWKAITIYFIFPPDGENTWTLADIIDYANRHRTLMRPNPSLNNPKITKEWFDIKFLIRMAH